jgi:hypothetical protein
LSPPGRRAQLFVRAAECYERAELPADAARCYAAAGRLASAAASYERAGDLPRAAANYKLAGAGDAAAPIFVELGRPADAAACWESVGDLLAAGWVLALHTREVFRARELLLSAPAADLGSTLRRNIGIGFCQARAGGRADRLVRAIQDGEVRIGAVPQHDERIRVVDWAVQAADRVGRHDLSARMWAAAYRCGTRTAARSWHRWAVDTLGDTLGLPELDEPAASGA